MSFVPLEQLNVGDVFYAPPGDQPARVASVRYSARISGGQVVVRYTIIDGGVEGVLRGHGLLTLVEKP